MEQKVLKFRMGMTMAVVVQSDCASCVLGMVTANPVMISLGMVTTNPENGDQSKSNN